MELYQEILVSILQSEDINVTFPNLKVDAESIVENECYKSLLAIKRIIENDNLSDKECFAKIEEIVSVFESIGSGGGNRHDFG